jgi:hypothetical protein
MLLELLQSQDLGILGPINFLKHALYWAVSQGFPLEFLVLLLLLPLAVSLVVLVRYLIGIQGLGIFTPVMMGVVFLSTGLIPGILFFLVILLFEILAIYLLKGFKVHFRAKMSLVLLTVCFCFFPLLIFFQKLNLQSLFSSALTSILVLVLLGENLVETQFRKPPQKIGKITIENLILAALSFFVLSSFYLRKMAVLYPELTILAALLINLTIGRFTGLRLLEYRRFRRLLKK